ncbi:SDR family NAD(P)-dependent oxidoreductase [Kitasatospora indigofera]|uniref:SDR family NAD(P)-dependent oxidoreductase n=1 Tax=Kitasatospora indigofera TaxID=67307 RepID=UPI0033AB7A85
MQGGGTFAAKADEIDAEFATIAGWSIVAELLRDEAQSRVTRTEVAQPATFLLQAGLVAELASQGVDPGAVVGHSVGEVAAAYVSGALGLHDALLVCHHRSRLQAGLAGSGGMLAVGLPEAEAQSWLGTDGTVCVAAVNSPSSVALAGPSAALEELAGRLHTAGVFTRTLQVNVPYHSALMNPVLAPLVAALGPLRPAVPAVPLYSSVSTGRVREPLLDAAYWSENVHRPVRFSDTVGALLGDGHRVFLELGPHPVLGGNLREILLRAGEPGTVVRTLVRGQDDEDSLVRCLADLYTAGCIDGSRVPGGTGGAVAHVDLPAYPWQRQHLWTEEPAVARMSLGTPGAFALLARRLDGSAPEWETEISATTLPWLRDHVVDGAVVLPGAAFLDAVLSAASRPGQSSVAVEAVEFTSPLVVDEHDVPTLRVAVQESTGRFTVRSKSGAAEDWAVHATGRVVGAPAEPSLAAFPPVRDGRRAGGSDLYDRLRRRGLAYGPAFRRISKAVVTADGVSAVLDTDSPGRGHLCHPAVLDAALQCVAALFTVEEAGVRTAIVPFRVASARWFAPFPPTVEAHVRRRTEAGLHADVRITDLAGTVLVELGDVEFRPVAPPLPVVTELDRVFYETVWEVSEATDDMSAAPRTAQKPALIIDLGLRGSVRTAELAAAHPGTALLSARDGRVTAARVTEALLAAVHGPDHERTMVVAVAGDTSPHDPVSEGIDQVALLTEAAHGVATALARITERAEEVEASEGDAATLVQRAEAMRGIVLTESAFRLPDDTRGPDLAHAALVGARRSLRNEQPGMRWRLVDAEPGSPLRDIETALGCGGPQDRDDEVCLRRGLWFAPRLRRSLAARVQHLATAAPHREADASYRLEVPESGGFAGLAFRSCERLAPSMGEVELRLDMIGLNYKDSMKILAVRTADELTSTYFGDTIGMEGFGVVTRVGAGVEGFEPGDRVFVMERDMFRRFLTMRTDGGFLRKVPDSLKPEHCTSMSPLVTAQYGLARMARLRAGETVLIHGAAGGVGLAAVQIAVALGAHVIGSASSEERRTAVLAAGADHVVNSRSVKFVADVLRMTNGRGADVVLNSAPGEIMRQNLNAAAEFGRIIEVGKTDIYAGGVMDLRPFDRNLSFTAIDMDRLMQLRPEVFTDVAQEVLDRLSSGAYRPLPATVRPAAELPDAFEAVARARCIGRVAVALQDVAEVLPPRPVFRARGDGTYIITGGFGALGLATARRLASLGARHLVLVGRSGAASDTARDQVRRLQSAGVEVTEERLDVGVRAQVAELVGRLSRTAPPIRGVFHAAGVSETRSAARSTAESVRRVAHAKALGAWNLHAVLDEAGITVDAFVLYSSMSALVGPAAQIGYTAANTVLDALAALRQGQGGAALSVNWGSLSGGGMAEESTEVERFLAYLGFRPMDMERATAMLAECLALEPRSPQVAVADMDWAAWAAANPASTDALRLSEPVAAARSRAADVKSLREELAALPSDQRAEVVAYILAEQLATVLGVAADTVELGVPLHDLGMDSLMGLEFTTRVLVALGMEVSTVELGGSGGLRELPGRISRRLGRADHSRRH